jgi:hypothetical protein
MRTNDTGVTLHQDGIALFSVKVAGAEVIELNSESDCEVFEQKLKQEGKTDITFEQVESGEEVTRGFCLLGDPTYKVNVVVEGVFTPEDREQKIADGYVEPYPAA